MSNPRKAVKVPFIPRNPMNNDTPSFYNQTKRFASSAKSISTIGSLFVVTRSLVQQTVQAEGVLIDRPQQLIGMSRSIFGNILSTHQSEVVPALTLEEELAASFLLGNDKYMFVYNKDGRLCLDTFHPAQRTIPRGNYVDSIIKVINDFKK